MIRALPQRSCNVTIRLIDEPDTVRLPLNDETPPGRDDQGASYLRRCLMVVRCTTDEPGFSTRKPYIVRTFSLFPDRKVSSHWKPSADGPERCEPAPWSGSATLAASGRGAASAV